VVNPLLLELYGDHEAGLISHGEFLEALQLLESFLFRRAVCAIPSNSHQKTFATFSRSLRKENSHYLPSFKAHLLSLSSYRRFPTDAEFRRDIQERNLYKFNKSCSYWLQKLENHQRKEPIAVANYTIEHILPQNPDLPAAWRQALGENWKALQEEWLHRLGNLTLTGYNPELSDRPFLDKRNHEGGFAGSPLRLNQGLGQLEAWGVEQIQERGATLADRALTVWAAPSLPPEQLAEYWSKPLNPAAAYSLADHPQLAIPHIRALFDALDLGIRALDPNVYQEVLKVYIAYKCETNVVDIVPQAKRLNLTLNMPFAELDDPKGLARNVAGLRRWGNGEVELGVATLEEVPYAIGLIRQSLERQLDDATGSP
jgi:predicted transport protein